MSELQLYYDSFNSGYWCDPDPNRCRCHGSGWALSEVDTWHQCPIHYTNQRHPEDDFYPDVCLECGDGANYPPVDCPHCGDKIKAELARAWDEVPDASTSEELPPYPPVPNDWDGEGDPGEIPF